MNKGKLLIGALLAIACTSVMAEGHQRGKWDGDKDGNISREEHAKMADAHFTKMDADGNNAISKDERKAAHQKMREHRKVRHEKRSEHRENAVSSATATQ